LIILFLFKVDISHIDSETTGLRILFVFKDNSVAIKSLSVQTVGVIHVSQVVKNVEC